MKKLRLFHIADGQVERQPASLFQYEKELQDLLEQHLHDFLGVHFLEREYATDSGYIDTLGIDDDGRPVIIEYKREQDKNVVGQALGYLGWLWRKKAEFTLLVIRKLSSERANNIRWSPRLLIIASDFRDTQVDAARNVQQLELLCYRRYGEQGFALEWVHGGEEEPVEPPEPRPGPGTVPQEPILVPGPTPFPPSFSTYRTWDKISVEVRTLFQELLAFTQTLGEMRVDPYKTSISFRRMKEADVRLKWPPVFAHVRPNITSGIRVDVLERTQSTPLEEGFTTLAKYASLYRTFVIHDRADLEKAKPLIREAYERH